MSLSGSRGRISAITRELWARWQDTKASWRDDRSAAFERQYLQELLIQVDKSVTVMEKLDELMSRVRKECE